MLEKLILVDEQDNQIGVMEKLQAHQEGRLHRAVSAVIFNSSGQMLIQQRALTKYHSAGIWANACCTHPRPGESSLEAIIRRLPEELGFTCPLEKKTTFIYKVELDNGLTEHELDHVFVGYYDGDIDNFNLSEVAQCKWIDVNELKKEIEENPNKYAYWFKKILELALSLTYLYLKINLFV